VDPSKQARARGTHPKHKGQMRAEGGAPRTYLSRSNAMAVIAVIPVRMAVA
jgi:hypothetical protein